MRRKNTIQTGSSTGLSRQNQTIAAAAIAIISYSRNIPAPG